MDLFSGDNIKNPRPPKKHANIAETLIGRDNICVMPRFYTLGIINNNQIVPLRRYIDRYTIPDIRYILRVKYPAPVVQLLLFTPARFQHESELSDSFRAFSFQRQARPGYVWKYR